jgi:HEPN domain-containing protein
MASSKKLFTKLLSKTALRAEQDLDDARYNLEGERYHLACPGGIPAEAFMKVDLYLHSKYSYDSFSEPLKIVKVPKRKGLYYMKTEAF